ncbi:hypothetical protein A2767_00820 [Candidatus Roizmanbacteria bacterium RIFCSPHIGHO2_01_FULL_35_10]|uniref:Uncharacterized protein n=1 Tax=Candidatus Roizmanbacteria bacterium RIFCSPLOWO2_01_FULL_35_13 TaxID=1802055 RepID=A0A1F7IDB7_9BACT|nr:MAG: hypothetical protein A2767_00820 [Candidatus Roizmanbacteria bacterium RIFCSPHIGHO2_01_FULL_35_10]OGK41345.1 MAG: hypothetical protein A3A74_03365 [Candidatus Roizmanbacteria bacterium RIFCSPLOWO2_01_FULL_35_13]
MTYLREGPLPRYERSIKPREINFVRLDGNVSVSQYEGKHAALAISDRLCRPGESNRWEKPVVTDAGLIRDDGDFLTIPSYKSGTTTIEMFSLDYSNADEMADTFKQIRFQTGSLIASLTKRPVHIEFDSGETILINP